MKIPILNLGTTPLADQFPQTRRDSNNQAFFPLGLTVDDQTWAMELNYLVPDELLFGDDYAFFTGASPTLKSYFVEYADWVRTMFPNQLPQGVCEIACNDGTLLWNFNEFRHLGIDPAKPAVREAKRRGLNVLHQAFDSDTAHEIDGPFGVVIANNVAAHVESLTDLLAGIAHLIQDEGYGVLEFQYAADLISDCLWPLVYHEHRRFLTLSSFIAACPPGLRVVDVIRTPAQGGSLRVVVTATDRPRTAAVTDLLTAEAWLLRMDTYSSLQGRVDYQVVRLQNAVDSFPSVALYGAPAKATTMVHYAGLYNDLVYAVDLTPSKIGRLVPGTGIPVIRPDQEEGWPEAYLVSVPNYLPTILRREQEFLASGRRLILPDGTVI